MDVGYNLGLRRRIGVALSQVEIEAMPQSATNTIRIAPPVDASIADLFSALVRDFPGTNFAVQLGDAHLGNFTARLALDEMFGAEALQRRRSLTTLSFSLPDNSLQVIFRRSISELAPNGAHMIQTPSALQNEITAFTSGHPAASQQIQLKVWATLADFASTYQARADLLSEPANAWGDIFGTQIGRLAELQTRLLEDAEADRRRAGEERLSLLDAAARQIEGERASAAADAEAGQLALQAERKELDAKRAQLDDSEHKFARRSMREQITADLKARLDKPAVSRGVRTQRSLVLLLATSGIAALVALTGWGLLELHAAFKASSGDHVVLIVAAIRVGLPAAAAMGLLAWLLSYQRQLAAEDARVERELERYRYDLDRASWVIETALEIQGQEGRTIPPDWLAGVTRNLFATSESKGEGTNALEALGSLLNFSGKLELGPSGSKLELSRGGLKRLAKSAAAENEA